MADYNILDDVQDGSLDQGGVADVTPLGNDVPADRGADTPPAAKDDKKAASSLRDQISNALKSETDTPPAAQQDGSRERNPDGTFKAKAPEADGTTQPQEPTVQSQSQSKPIVVPAGIDPKVFTSLPAETQEYIGRTMEGVNIAAQRYAALEQMIAPRYQAWALNGMTPEGAINQLLALSDFAGRDPAGFVKYFAQQQNLNLEDIAFGPDPVDPTVANLQGQIAQLQQQLGGMTNAQAQAQQQALMSEIVTAIEAKDASGNDLYPHMEAIGDELLPFIQQVRTANPNLNVPGVIKEAYERACWANPSIRQTLQAQQAQAAQAQQLAQSQEAARRAQRAGSSVPSGAPSAATSASQADNGARTLRDQIRASIAAQSN